MLLLGILNKSITGFCFGSATSPAFGSNVNGGAVVVGASSVFSSSLSSAISCSCSCCHRFSSSAAADSSSALELIGYFDFDCWAVTIPFAST
jgi:hypothetical protein